MICMGRVRGPIKCAGLCCLAAASCPSICRWWRKTVWNASAPRKAVKSYTWVQVRKYPARASTVATTPMSSGTRWRKRWGTPLNRTFHFKMKRWKLRSACFLQSIKAVSEQRRAFCEQDGWLHLCQVHKQDTGVYFCDRQIIEQGAAWIFRRAVNVTTIRKCRVHLCASTDVRDPVTHHFNCNVNNHAK